MPIGEYSTRTSHIGTSKPDPVLSAFSPLGTSKIRSETVAEIQPRTATPTQSSAMALSVINATPLDTPYSFDKNNKEGEKIESYRAPSAIYEKNASEGLKRLSITGRLSQEPTTPASQLVNKQENSIRDRFSFHKTPTASREPSHSPAHVTNSASEYKFEVTNDQVLKGEQYKFEVDKLESGKYEGRFESKFLTETHKATDYRYDNLSRAVESRIENSKTVAKGQSLESQPVSSNSALNEMIRSCIDRSMSDFMQGIESHIQNLHIEVIKQNLAQQVTNSPPYIIMFRTC